MPLAYDSVEGGSYVLLQTNGRLSKRSAAENGHNRDHLGHFFSPSSLISETSRWSLACGIFLRIGCQRTVCCCLCRHSCSLLLLHHLISPCIYKGIHAWESHSVDDEMRATLVEELQPVLCALASCGRSKLLPWRGIWGRGCVIWVTDGTGSFWSMAKIICWQTVLFASNDPNTQHHKCLSARVLMDEIFQQQPEVVTSLTCHVFGHCSERIPSH